MGAARQARADRARGRSGPAARREPAAPAAAGPARAPAPAHESALLNLEVDNADGDDVAVAQHRALLAA
ncbi:hypothetical protein ABZX86_11775, partial [Nocardia sp. NPDC006630]